MNWKSLLENPRLLVPRLWRKIRLAFNPNTRAIFTLEDGSLFECALGDSTGRLLTLGVLEPTEREFTRHWLKPGDIFFDIGANIGLFTLIAARQVGSTGHVYAFEPSQREAALLQRNLNLNHLTNVTIVSGAVGDKSGIAQLGISTDGGTNSLRKNPHPQQQINSWQSVQVITLDEFIAANNIQRVDLMKIDVEGGEVNVLRGASHLLNGNHPPVVLCEFCDLTAAGFESSGRKLYDAFVSFGYQLYSIQKRMPTTLLPAPPKEQYDFENLVAQKSHKDRA
jgi:FkbM family methyltransferase